MQLQAQSLSCHRGGRLVFERVSFSLGPGEALLVTGRNGAGKSTLLAAIAGRLRPTEGQVLAEGLEDRPLPEALHWIGHRDALKSALTAEENLAFARDLLGDPWLTPREALAEVRLAGAAGLPVGYLSAGQRRRVALARLLVARRPLWLLDEPTAALDEPAQRVLLALMGRHLGDGGLLIAATHAPLGLGGAKDLRLAPSSPRLRGEDESTEGRPGEGALQHEPPPHPDAARLDLSPRAGKGE